MLSAVHDVFEGCTNVSILLGAVVPNLKVRQELSRCPVPLSSRVMHPSFEVCHTIINFDPCSGAVAVASW